MTSATRLTLPKTFPAEFVAYQRVIDPSNDPVSGKRNENVVPLRVPLSKPNTACKLETRVEEEVVAAGTGTQVFDHLFERILIAFKNQNGVVTHIGKRLSAERATDTSLILSETTFHTEGDSVVIMLRLHASNGGMLGIVDCAIYVVQTIVELTVA